MKNNYMVGGRMTRRTLKREVYRILGNRSLQEIHNQLKHYADQELISPLFSALCSTDEMVRWHSVSAFGQIVPRIADQDFESARIIMRRLLWSLNDESGGIGWGSPEAMAEIMAMDHRIAGEYLHMLISYMREDGPELFQDGNYLELPMLQRGLLWGIGRLCSTRLDLLRANGVAADLRGYLASEDYVVRGMAIWCLGLLSAEEAKDEVVLFSKDKRIVTLYISGQLEEYTIRDLVGQYLERIKEAHAG